MEYKIIDGELTEVRLGETETEVTIPDGVASIGDCAFYRCGGIQRVFIPEGVIRIGEQAFYKCANLTEVNLPESIEKIEEQAFWLCDRLAIKTVPGSYGEKWVRDRASLPPQLSIRRTKEDGETPLPKWAMAKAEYICYDNQQNVTDPLAFPDGLPLVGTTVSALASLGFCGEINDIFYVVYEIKDDASDKVPNIVVLKCRLDKIMDVQKNDSGDDLFAWIRLEILSCHSIKEYALMEGVTDTEEAERVFFDMGDNLITASGDYFTGYDNMDCVDWSFRCFSFCDDYGYFWIYHDKQGFDHLIVQSYTLFNYCTDSETLVGNLILGKHEDVRRHYYSKGELKELKEKEWEEKWRNRKVIK